MAFANIGTGGDCDSAIFEQAREMGGTYSDARQFFLRARLRFRAATLENYDYNSSNVRALEIHRGRLHMMKFELSEHSAQDIMRKRLKAKDGEILDKKKVNMVYISKLDLLIALQGVHVRLYKFVENVISEKDELKLRREIQEVEAMAALDLELCRDLEQFEKNLKKYVSLITDPKHGVVKKGIIDDNDDPIDIVLVDKELKKVYIGTVRVIINASDVYNPKTGVSELVSFSSEGHCIKWNIYVEGGDQQDCTFDDNSLHALIFHKCPRHPWHISDKQIKHREVQCPSLRKVFKPTVFDPSITLPASKVPKAFRKGSRDYDYYSRSKGDSGGSSKKHRHGSHSYRGGSDQRGGGDYRGSRDSQGARERNGTPKTKKEEE